MKQSVDLYQACFQETPELLPARLVVHLCTALLAAFVLLFAFAQLQAWREGRVVEAAEAQQAATTLRVAELAQSHPPRSVDPALEREVARLAAERDGKTRLLRLLGSASLGNVEGFSPQLSGLARERVEGLWLRGVAIGRGGGDLLLRGSALEPELLPRFIQQLGREEIFAGRVFRSLRMERAEEAPGRLDFVLSTREEAP